MERLNNKGRGKVRDETIRQAAKDYDMDYDTAKWIHDKDPDLFYENMEEYIKERARANWH